MNPIFHQKRLYATIIVAALAIAIITPVLAAQYFSFSFNSIITVPPALNVVVLNPTPDSQGRYLMTFTQMVQGATSTNIHLSNQGSGDAVVSWGLTGLDSSFSYSVVVHNINLNIQYVGTSADLQAGKTALLPVGYDMIIILSINASNAKAGAYGFTFSLTVDQAPAV